MTSQERVAAVLAGALPDRVPVLMQNFQNTAFLSGISLRDFCQSGELMADAQYAAWERFKYDVVDLENGTAAMAEACGCEVEYPLDGPPCVVKPALASLDDLDSLRPVDPTRDGKLPELLKATRLMRERLAGRACIVGESDQGPFDLAALLVGMESWLVVLMTPEQHAAAHRLLAYAMEQVSSLALAQAAAGADFTEIGDPLGGPDVCSPKVYREFAFPYERQLAAQLNSRGIPLILHMCGDATPIIADMASTGAPMLEVDYKIDAWRCRAATENGPVLVGNIDPSGVMALGTPDQVFAKSREAIEQLGPRGRFILSPGCTLPATTPPENTAAMIAAAIECGRYGSGGLLLEPTTSSPRPRP